MIDRIALFSNNLHPIYKVKYDKLCQILSPRFLPIVGYRSFEEQDKLFKMGRTTMGLPCMCKKPCLKHPLGLIVTKSRPGLSYHNYGIATDWGYFDKGRYVALSYADPRWAEYFSACKEVRLQTLSFERPHNQLKLPVDINIIYEAYLDGGIKAAHTCITEVLK